MKGLSLTVHRSDLGDCTNGGISAGARRLILVGYRKVDGGEILPLPEDCRVFSPDEQSPAVVLVPSRLPAKYGPHLEPLIYGVPEQRMVGPMHGGNYASSCDSRWSKLGELYGDQRIDAVAIHDRFETAGQYASYD